MCVLWKVVKKSAIIISLVQHIYILAQGLLWSLCWSALFDSNVCVGCVNFNDDNKNNVKHNLSMDCVNRQQISAVSLENENKRLTNHFPAVESAWMKTSSMFCRWIVIQSICMEFTVTLSVVGVARNWIEANRFAARAWPNDEPERTAKRMRLSRKQREDILILVMNGILWLWVSGCDCGTFVEFKVVAKCGHFVRVAFCTRPSIPHAQVHSERSSVAQQF